MNMARKVPAKKQAAQGAGQKKSGIKSFKAGDTVFKVKDVADSLFIIQKGQIRLFLPKGRGFVDIAILRSGEVIGEMGYFDEKARRRSCSASAILDTEVVEISYKAFEKTMAGLNPWFKTIINTLADRLRKTNEKVKSLETNSVGFGKDGKVSNYKFFHSIDIIRILSLMFLAFKSMGESRNNRMTLHANTLKLYMQDIFNVPEIKFEEFKIILQDLSLLKIDKDEDGLPKLLSIVSPDEFKNLANFINSQRLTADEKKLTIGANCEELLSRIIKAIGQTEEGKEKKAKINFDLREVIAQLRAEGSKITEGDLADAVKHGLCSDIMVENNALLTDVSYVKLLNVFPAMKMLNRIEQVNRDKAE